MNARPQLLTILLGLAMGLAAGCKQGSHQPSPASAPTSAPAAPLIVMTAASAKEVMTEIGSAYRAETGTQVTVVAGASNVLATQILAGSPASLFLSANQDWAMQLNDKRYAAKIRPLLTNGLVLIVPRGNPAGVKSPADLNSPRVKKVALAGPGVPAGKYAEQALRAAGVYASLSEQGRFARGQDVRVTLSFIERGEADAGIVYSTDVIHSKQVEVVHTFDPTTYEPIVYPLVLLKSAENDPAAVRFYDYLASANAEKAFAKHEFVRIKP